MTHFTGLPDLAVRTLGGSVVHANDELFAQRENLVNPAPAVFDPATFGHKGKVFDGWETRRRREPGHDVALVRLGAAGVVRGVVIDTSWFTGNYPPQASLDAVCLPGHPSVPELMATTWEPILDRVDLAGDTANAFSVTSDRRWTHVRLSIHPDGGVARLRVHGEVLADPRYLDHGVDLAALEHGARVVGCSDEFYGAPARAISPGLARTMGEGWETARRRDDGNDWFTVRLVGAGVVRQAEIDTSHFVGNAPGEASLSGCDAGAEDPDDPASWRPLLRRTRLQPDTRHRFLVPDAGQLTHVRLDIHPDGGIARLRLHGELTAAGRSALGRTWFDALPAAAAGALLTEEAGLSAAQADQVVGTRPLGDLSTLPTAARTLIAGRS